MTFVDIAIVSVLSFVLSMLLGYAYRHTHRGVSYSQTYVHTLVIIGTVIALVMLVIGSNIARAFALVGSLSIIRFRNAMKEPRDIAFLFCVIAVDMAVGTRFYGLAVVASLALSAIVMLLGKLNLFAKTVRERILRSTSGDAFARGSSTLSSIHDCPPRTATVIAARHVRRRGLWC